MRLAVEPDDEAAVEALQPSAPLRVGWCLIGDRTTASSRCQGYTIHDWLNDNTDIASEIIWQPRAFAEAPGAWAFLQILFRLLHFQPRILVFQKTGGRRFQILMRFSKLLGIKNVFVDCDLRERYAFSPQVTCFVVPSENLKKDIYEKTGRRPTVIDDPAEFGLSFPPADDRDRHAVTRGVWVGRAPNWESIQILKDDLGQRGNPGFSIETISDHPSADVAWRLELFPEILHKYDFGVIPSLSNSASLMKSPNRAVLFMAAGLPVLAQSKAVYRDVIEHGVNGFLFDNADEFIHSVERLRNRDTYDRIVQGGYETVRSRFCVERIGQAWVELFSRMGQDSRSL